MRSSKSTSSPPALFAPGKLSGMFGRSVGTDGRSGKLGPFDERGAGVGAVGAEGFCGPRIKWEMRKKVLRCLYYVG